MKKQEPNKNQINTATHLTKAASRRSICFQLVIPIAKFPSFRFVKTQTSHHITKQSKFTKETQQSHKTRKKHRSNRNTIEIRTFKITNFKLPISAARSTGPTPGEFLRSESLANHTYDNRYRKNQMQITECRARINNGQFERWILPDEDRSVYIVADEPITLIHR